MAKRRKAKRAEKRALRAIGAPTAAVVAPLPPAPESALRQRVAQHLKKVREKEASAVKQQNVKENPIKKTGVAKASVSTLKRSLPGKSILELRQLWLNSLRMMDRIGGYTPKELISLMQAIETEWEKRGLIGEVSSEDYFKWPSTDAPTMHHSKVEFEAPGQGVLGYLEYHVGKTNGQPLKVRRALLDRIFAGKLPPVFDKKYLMQWGSPGTSQRLQKMAECIAAFARNFKRRDDDKLDTAIQEWEADLLYLYDNYYVGKFRFAWPVTKVN